MTVDVHQHLWPPGLVEALRSRSTPPRLRGWTLDLVGEAPFEVNPDDHDVRARAACEDSELALVSLSSPLGIEHLPPAEAEPLLTAFHAEAANLPEPFLAWASANVVEPDAASLEALLDRGFVGLQLPATALSTPAAWEHVAPLLDVIDAAGVPLFIHPGPSSTVDSGSPSWWPAMTDYVAQMQRAWFGFRVAGRSAYPNLSVCFAMLAGLAPLHGERFAARAGAVGPVDPWCFVETSSYGPRAIDAVLRVLGVDVLVRGSDAPYARAADADIAQSLGPAAAHAIAESNPRRLLEPRKDPA